MSIDLIIVAVLVAIVGAAAGYIVKAKKSGATPSIALHIEGQKKSGVEKIGERGKSQWIQKRASITTLNHKSQRDPSLRITC